ncbi:hypothetical protein [Methylobacter luteus]|uniref:hypothetical protein n=1 Tax=Methylobacter luteus TaxID=415 RepID=UPI000415FC62|nr:hypothetical protein [Methylobacter luteus]
MNLNTVFVIGAGASKEANLPTGYELKKEISKILDIRYDDFGHRLDSGDYKIIGALDVLARQPNNRKGDISPYLCHAWHIRDALPQAISIDNFIDAHRDNDKIALCGKLAIVRSILAAEKKSLLYFKQERSESNINFSALENTWYIPFFQLLTENCTKDDLKERFKTITLIIFNYDRCIEHFLFCALQNYYKISEPEAAELVRSINIYHPYGNVGTLPMDNRGDGMMFGESPSAENLLRLAQKIKTFTEGTDPESSEITAIRKRMTMATRLVFMGFAFHKLNMQLIAPGYTDDHGILNIRCFATTLGISYSDREVIMHQINDLYSNASNHVSISTLMTDGYCGEFLKEYWRSLSF